MRKLAMHDAAVSRMLRKQGPIAERPLHVPLRSELSSALKAKKASDLQNLLKTWRRDPFPF